MSKSRLFGTSPNSKYWLNLDCCGLFCAVITWFLHIWASYTLIFRLLSPWMGPNAVPTIKLSAKDLDVNPLLAANAPTNRSGWYEFHVVAFITIMGLALVSHGRAMMTDPGAVPVDAKPVGYKEEEEDVVPNLDKIIGDGKKEDDDVIRRGVKEGETQNGDEALTVLVRKRRITEPAGGAVPILSSRPALTTARSVAAAL
eukprot:CAMPEP_0118661596 /NCGR_PEP_ID=MMETSP0785-20121206/16373_1 /TAXON_ID=91992 /ORGANISM="Bolidomonas pacifica, Strain CCMP 1866" /LENGTH=199 /DNA_ID=CAMNT_0006555065 /DNA_START=130 /DNA_END=730 /DNA_ORIENTATION=+